MCSVWTARSCNPGCSARRDIIEGAQSHKANVTNGFHGRSLRGVVVQISERGLVFIPAGRAELTEEHGNSHGHSVVAKDVQLRDEVNLMKVS